jgi:hypothetical protein
MASEVGAVAADRDERGSHAANDVEGTVVGEEAHAMLLVGFTPKATALDVAHDGKQVGSAPTGTGVDIIAYNPARAHLYVPGGDSATLTIVGVGAGGKLDVLGSVPVAVDSHCVAADDAAHAYVCDPKQGALLVITDPYPTTK